MKALHKRLKTKYFYSYLTGYIYKIDSTGQEWMMFETGGDWHRTLGPWTPNQLSVSGDFYPLQQRTIRYFEQSGGYKEGFLSL